MFLESYRFSFARIWQAVRMPPVANAMESSHLLFMGLLKNIQSVLNLRFNGRISAVTESIT